MCFTMESQNFLLETRESVHWLSRAYSVRQNFIRRRNHCLKLALFTAIATVALLFSQKKAESFIPALKVPVQTTIQTLVCLSILSSVSAGVFDYLANEKATEEKDAINDVYRNLLSLTVEQSYNHPSDVRVMNCTTDQNVQETHPTTDTDLS